MSDTKSNAGRVLLGLAASLGGPYSQDLFRFKAPKTRLINEEEKSAAMERAEKKREMRRLKRKRVASLIMDNNPDS